VRQQPRAVFAHYSITPDMCLRARRVQFDHSDAELDAHVIGHSSVTLSHPGLHFGRAPQGIDHTAELDEKPIACGLDEPAVVRGDRRINQLGPDGLELREGAALVRANQS